MDFDHSGESFLKHWVDLLPLSLQEIRPSLAEKNIKRAKKESIRNFFEAIHKKKASLSSKSKGSSDEDCTR